ncbi:unnamed protein product, partial [Rotaria magnacalcarata]
LICVFKQLFAIDLLIYNSFTELRENEHGQGMLTYSFNNDAYANIISGSISWIGTPFIRQELLRTMSSLKGAKVIVKGSSACGCSTIKATIIDPTSMLLQNEYTKSYFYTDPYSIQYVSTPLNDISYQLKIIFSNKNEAYSGILSYLTTGITWAPNYDLFLTDDDKWTFDAYVNIKNALQRQYNVNNTYLIGGNVQLASSIPPVSTLTAPLMKTVMASSSQSSSNVQLDTEQQGLYSYSFHNGYTLQGLSTIRMPFVNIHPTYKFYYEASSSIETGQYQGVFMRMYDLTPDSFMPAGVLTIRQNGTLLGQANLPDIPSNYTQTISLGQDNNIRYVVNGNMTSSILSNNIVTMQTFYLIISITNYQHKAIQAKLQLYGAIQTILNSSTCQSAMINGNYLIIVANLASGKRQQCTVNVTLKYT